MSRTIGQAACGDRFNPRIIGMLGSLGAQLPKNHRTSIKTSLRWGSQGAIGSHRESVSMDASCLGDDGELDGRFQAMA